MYLDLETKTIRNGEVNTTAQPSPHKLSEEEWREVCDFYIQ